MMEFYLFDVEHGQSAAIRLPNGRWCLFDAGDGRDGSPTEWIRRREAAKAMASTLLTRASVSVSPLVQRRAFRDRWSAFQYLKVTIGHLHHDHLSDWETALGASPGFLRTVHFDGQYLQDVKASSHEDSFPSVLRFCQAYNSGFSPATIAPDYGAATITEYALPVTVARTLGGTANSRVNNASVITRIDCYSNSILLCGDMEAEAWEYALNLSPDKGVWRSLVANVDILIAPHHGHSSAYSTVLMAWAKPSVVLISVKSYDMHVDGRYSSDSVGGIVLDGIPYKRITTRKNGTIKIEIAPPTTILGKGSRTWTLNHSLT